MTNLLSISRLTPTIFIKCLWVLLFNKTFSEAIFFILLLFVVAILNITFDRIKLIRVETWESEMKVKCWTFIFVTFSIVSQCTRSEHFCNLNHIFNSFYFYHLQKVIRLFNLFNKLIEHHGRQQMTQNVIWQQLYSSVLSLWN